MRVVGRKVGGGTTMKLRVSAMYVQLATKNDIGKKKDSGIMYKCRYEGCSREFPRIDNRNRHENDVHLKIPKPMTKCDWCGKDVQKCSLKKHQRTCKRRPLTQ